MKIGELRKRLRKVDKKDLTELIVEVYKVLPKEVIEEELIDDIIDDWSGYLDIGLEEMEIQKNIVGGNQKNVTSIAALQKWQTIPEAGRQMLLENVWCSHCGDTCRLIEYTVESVGADIVLRGTCPVCRHDVARYVEGE